MASIEKRIQGRATSWRVRWYQDSKQQRETFFVYNEAVEFRGLVDAAGQRWPVSWVPGEGFPPPQSAITVADWCARSIAARTGIQQRTRGDYQRLLDRHLGELEGLALPDLTRETYGLWLNSLEDLSPKTIKNIHGTLSSCLNDAVLAGEIAFNPAKGLRLPQADADTDEIVPLSDSDVALIRAQLDDHWHPLVDCLYDTGTRFGEATALQPEHLNPFDSPSLRVAQAWKRQDGGGYLLGPPKTKRGKRTITITDKLRDGLLPLLAAGNEFLFTTETGKPVTHAHFWLLHWRPAVFAAQSCDAHRGKRWNKHHTERPTPCGCPGTLRVSPRIHDLRHAHASRLIAAGIAPIKLQYRLGHESIQTTYNVYGHLFRDNDDDVMAALGQQISSSLDDAPPLAEAPRILHR